MLNSNSVSLRNGIDRHPSAELAGHIHAPLLAEHVPAPGMPGKSGDEQYSNTLEKLEDLRRVEAEARRRALPSEQPVQVARRQLQGVAERLHDVWPPSASTELSNERRSNALVEHAKRSTSIRATVNNLRSATVDEEHWLKAWQLRCETQLTLAQAAAAAAAESVTKGPHYVDSWQRLGQHIASLRATLHGTRTVRAARDEPRAYIEALEHSQERHARLLLEAAVTSNGMSTYAARERTVLMGHVDLAALRRTTDAHGVSLESALCLLLDRDVSELKEYARRPRLLGESACAVLHPAGIMTFAVHLAHTPRAFYSPLYRRDLAKALMMADQQVRITMPTADGPVLVELKVYDAAEAAAALPKAVTRLEQWQVLGTRVTRVAELGSRPTVAVIEDVRCDFWFLQADVLRGALGPLPPNLHRQRSMYEKLPIALSAARVGAYARDFLVVSHIWESASDPDPRGLQVDALRQFLRENPRFKHVWYDFWTLPAVAGRGVPSRLAGGLEGGQSAVSSFDLATDANADARMRELCPLLFLGCSVLLLLSDEYAERFECTLEAWLAMQACTDAGMRPAPCPRERCYIRTLPGCHRAQPAMLIESWSGLLVEEAMVVHGNLANLSPLQSPRAAFGGERSRVLQRVQRLDEQVREASVNARLTTSADVHEVRGLRQQSGRVLSRLGASAGEALPADALLRPPAAAPTPKRVALHAPAESEREVDDAPAPASKRTQQAGPDWVQYASWVADRNPGEFSNLEL